jgi:hypothetical protein
MKPALLLTSVEQQHHQRMKLCQASGSAWPNIFIILQFQWPAGEYRWRKIAEGWKHWFFVASGWGGHEQL